MAQTINALCYCNDTITKGPQGVDYEGSFAKTVTILSTMTFSELVDRVCRKLKIDRNQYTIKIIYRYPQVFQQSNLVFGALEIADDEDLGILVATATSIQGVVRCAELYVETVPIRVQNSVEAPSLEENQDPLEERNHEVETYHTQMLADPYTQSHPTHMTPQSDHHHS